MPKPIALRRRTGKEQETLEKIAKSQTALARQGERAKTVLLAHRKIRAVDIAEKIDHTPMTINRRLRLFNEFGLEILEDHPDPAGPRLR